MTINREAWLTALVDAVRPLYAAAGYTVPAKIRVTCGFPSKGGTRKPGTRRLGECWQPRASASKHAEIFVTPLLDKVEEVCETVVHEVGHSLFGDKSPGHRAPWSKAVKAVGLDGTAHGGAIGGPLPALLAAFVAAHGEYPHARLHEGVCGKKKQSTRMLKCECPKCGYTCRTTRKWLDEAGAPWCPTHKKPMLSDDNGTEEEEEDAE